MLLAINSAAVHYRKVAALKGVDLAVDGGGLVTIIGANGAGKSTLLRAISGLVPLSGGGITFEGERIDGLPGGTDRPSGASATCPRDAASFRR